MSAKKTPKTSKSAVMESEAPKAPETPLPPVPSSTAATNALMLRAQTLVTQLKPQVMEAAELGFKFRMKVAEVAPLMWEAWKAAEAAGQTQVEFARMFDPTCPPKKEHAMGIGKPGQPGYVKSNSTYMFIVNTLRVAREQIAEKLELAKREVNNVRQIAVAAGVKAEEITAVGLVANAKTVEEVEKIRDGITALASVVPTVKVLEPTATDPEVKKAVEKPTTEAIAEALESAKIEPTAEKGRTSADTIADLKKAFNTHYMTVYAAMLACTPTATPESIKHAEHVAFTSTTTFARSIFEALGKPVKDGSQFEKAATGFKTTD